MNPIEKVACGYDNSHALNTKINYLDFIQKQLFKILKKIKATARNIN